jgi:hypothetical protein
MKVTALIPDKLVRQVKQLSQAKTITEGLVIALEEWVSQQKLRKLNSELEENPLRFASMSAADIRALNRRRS